MEKPSKKWIRIRRAVLERAQRTTIEPLESLFTIYVAVCVYYVVGSMRFHFFDRSADFTLVEAMQLMSVAAAGVMVPFLTGSVVTLYLARRNFEKLVTE